MPPKFRDNHFLNILPNNDVHHLDHNLAAVV